MKKLILLAAGIVVALIATGVCYAKPAPKPGVLLMGEMSIQCTDHTVLLGGAVRVRTFDGKTVTVHGDWLFVQ